MNTIRGLTSRSCSKPRPRRSRAPGRIASTTASAPRTSSRKASLPGFRAEIEHDASFAPVDVEEQQRDAFDDGPRHPPAVVALRRLDLDDLGAEVGEVRGDGAGPEHRDLDDPHAGERGELEAMAGNVVGTDTAAATVKTRAPRDELPVKPRPGMAQQASDPLSYQNAARDGRCPFPRDDRSRPDVRAERPHPLARCSNGSSAGSRRSWRRRATKAPRRPGPDTNVVLHVVDADAPKSYRRKAAPTFVIAIAEVPEPPDDMNELRARRLPASSCAASRTCACS